MTAAPTPQPENTTTTAVPATQAVTDRSAKPQGVLPKNMQSWIWIAAILVIGVGIFFSGGPKKPSAANAATSQPVAVPAEVGGLTPDQVAKRLQDSEETARRNGITTTQPGEQPQPGNPRYSADAAFLAANQPPTAPARDPIEEEERKREYFSRYASNVALSYRTDAHPTNGLGPSPQTFQSTLANFGGDPAAQLAGNPPALLPNLQRQLDSLQTQQQHQLSTLQQELAGASNLAPTLPGTQQAQAAPVPPRKTVSLNSATGKNHVVFEGTVLESVLINRLNGDFAGPVICQVTTDLYSHDHSTLLIPSGSRILGETRKVDATGQERLAVVFHRLIMPDGFSVDLDQAPGLNQIGETALKDKVNNHYFKIFGASIAVGAIAGLATIGTNNSAVTGLPTSTSDAYRQGVASSLSQSSLRILDKFLNIVPTITIREGHRIRVFLTQDLTVPAYSNHTIPSDL